MEGSLTGPMSNMAWMKQVASEHGGFLSWTTPDGLPVQQHYAVNESYQVVCHIGGGKVNLRAASPSKQAEVSRQKAGIAPNFIHSLDACHMRMYIRAALAAGIRDFSMIHDSYGCHPNDGDTMQRLIREAFISLYLDNDIPGLLHKLAPCIPPLAMGTLDLEQVQGAEYFFA
jgi:DNA-directed RNA polymerase